MNSISKLSRGYLKANKGQYLLISLTIILTTCLITAIGIISFSIEKMLQNEIVEMSGSHHGSYSNITSNQLDILKNNQKLEAVGEILVLGTINNKKTNEAGALMIYSDINAAQMSNMVLAEGNFPTNSREVAAEKWVFEELGIEPKVGDFINLKYTRNLNSTIKTEEQSFIISGILKDNEFLKTAKQSQVIFSKSFALVDQNIGDANYNVLIRVKGKDNIENTLSDVANSVGIKSQYVSVNKEYIDTFKLNFEVIIPAVIVGLVVIVAAFIVIYNIFYVSVVSRINQLGLLAAIGVTKKQIKNLIFKEGMILSSVGVPLGLLIGYALSYIIISRITLESTKLNIQVTPYIIIGSALVSYITIIISLRRPGRIASKISPMEAVRYNGTEADVKKKYRKGSNEITLRSLAYDNLWRNKKRTIMTLLSLTMSGILFIIFSTILSSMNVENLVKQYIRTDFQLNLDMTIDNNNTINEALLKDIQKINGIKSVNAIMYSQVFMPNSINIKQPDNKDINLMKLNCDFYGLDEELLKESKQYVIDGEISLDSLKNNNEVLLVKEENEKSSFKIGDKISLEIRSKEKTYDKEFIIKGIVSSNVGYLGFKGMGPSFIVHEETFQREIGDKMIKRICVNAQEKSFDQINNKLKIIASDNKLNFVSQKEYRTKMEGEMKSIKATIMSLVFIIALIGILNLANTMITSILSRKKEIGMMQAIGLTNTQLIKMLQLEGLYYAAISVILSITGGSGLGYIFFKAFRKSATYAEYKYPFIPTMLVICVFFIAQILITYLVAHNLNKNSVVERIRYSE